MNQTPPRRVRRAQATGFVAWAALIALQPLWHAWLAPPAHMPVLLALLTAVVPLLLPLLALRRPPRALLLAGMLALFYFCHGVSEAWSVPAERALALVEVVFSLLLIGSLGVAVQRRKKPA